MFADAVKKFKLWKEDRFLKKHGVDTWEQYHHRYDPDFNEHARTVREMLHGYPYIAEIHQLRSTESLWYEELEDLQNLLVNCKGKARKVLARTVPEYYYQESFSTDSPLIADWSINEFGLDSLFIGFQDERDYLLFLLKWKTA